MMSIKKISKSAVFGIAAAVAVVAMLIAMSGKKPVSVKAISVKPGELRVVVNATTTSTVKSETEVTLSAQRTGRVVALTVKEGDAVQAGQVICKLDLTEESVQSERVLGQSRATFEESEKNLKRIQGLFDKGMLAQQDLDAARRAYEVAKSQYEAARSDAGIMRDYSIIKAPFNGVVA